MEKDMAWSGVHNRKLLHRCRSSAAKEKPNIARKVFVTVVTVVTVVTTGSRCAPMVQDEYDMQVYYAILDVVWQR